MRRATESLVNLSRRGFLRTGAAFVGGLVLGVPRASRAADAAIAGFATPVGSWIRVAEDGRVTIWVEKAEMGQGVHSTLAALVAEELDVEWDQVAVESRTFDGPLRNVITGASTSIRDAYEPLRIAGAAARAMLVAAAADIWSVPVSECAVSRGRISHAPTRRGLDYGEVAARAASRPVPSQVELKPPEKFRLLGTDLPRLDVPDKVRGEAIFGIDVKIEGMLHAAPAFSKARGGRLERAEHEAARRMDGVRAVVEIPSGVAVVADHYWQARKALEVLAPVFTGGEAAIDTPAYSLELREALDTPGLVAGEIGDAESVFARGNPVIEARYEVPYLAHATMEPMNCTASVRDDRCEIWAPTQAPSQIREDVGRALEIEPENVTVHATLMGGGFGRRAETDYAVQAALASRAVARPVKLIWSREDDLRHDFYRPACAAHLRASLDASGRPEAFVHHVAGPYSDRALPSWLRAAIGRAEKRIGSPLAPEGYLPDFVWWRLPHVARSGIDWIVAGSSPPLNYRVPNQRLEYSLVENPLPIGWWRAVPASQNAFFLESFIDELAHAASSDPFEFRRALLTGRDRDVLDRAAELSGWGRPPRAGRALGIAQFAMVGTTVCQVAEVSVDGAGVPKVHRVFCAIDCGRALNPDTIRAQVEGSILFGLSAALRGRITVRDGRVEQSGFHDYPILGFGEIPEIEVTIIESDAPPTGVGEPATPPIAPAVANAIFAASGRRIRSLPLSGVAKVIPRESPARAGGA